MTMMKREPDSIWNRVREDRDVDDLIFGEEFSGYRENLSRAANGEQPFGRTDRFTPNLNTAAVTFQLPAVFFYIFRKTGIAFRHLEFLTGKSKVFLPKGVALRRKIYYNSYK